MWDDMAGGGWMFLWGLIMIAGIVVLVWGLAAAVGSGRSRAGSRSPHDILAERFARGEISADEYRERLRALDER